MYSFRPEVIDIIWAGDCLTFLSHFWATQVHMYNSLFSNNRLVYVCVELHSYIPVKVPFMKSEEWIGCIYPYPHRDT